MDLILPYKVGDLVESKSFLEGYRGAWFRSKIYDIKVSESSGHLELYLEYIDYPDESKEWVRLFQKDQACSEQQATDQIMIRPSFPRWYWNGDVSVFCSDNDLIAIVSEHWKVGDRVDWLCEDSYWSGNITKLLDEDTVEVELLKPPIGEVQHYNASCMDLRPTLDWSLERGWSVPLSQAEGKCWHVARLIHSIPTEPEKSKEEASQGDGYNDENDSHSGDGQDLQLHITSSNIIQPSVINSQRNITQNQTIDVRGQYLQTVAEVRCKLKDLLKRTLLMERRAGLFGKWAWGRDSAR